MSLPKKKKFFFFRETPTSPWVPFRAKFRPLGRLFSLSCPLAWSLQSFSAKILDWRRYFIHKLKLYCALASKKKSIPDWHLYITHMETKWTKWYAMRSHVIAYQSTELLFGAHAFNFNCFFDDFNCVFTQIRCLSRLLDSCENLENFPLIWLLYMHR